MRKGSFRSIVPKEFYPRFAHGEDDHPGTLDPYFWAGSFYPNRDQLDARQLKTALENLQLKEDKSFHTVNFLLPGFWLARQVSPALIVYLKS